MYDDDNKDEPAHEPDEEEQEAIKRNQKDEDKKQGSDLTKHSFDKGYPNPWILEE